AQRRLGDGHGAAPEFFVLTQEQEILAELVLRERSRVALEMISQPTHHADVLLFGGRPVIFEFDKLGELRDRGIVNIQRWERMSSRDDKTAHQIFNQRCSPQRRSNYPAAQRLSSTRSLERTAPRRFVFTRQSFTHHRLRQGGSSGAVAQSGIVRPLPPCTTPS